jgi:electron transport complex protein RnfE
VVDADKRHHQGKPGPCARAGDLPTLAVSTQASNAVGMGIAATAVLICSNMAISLLRNAIPDKVRIPCYIVLIAGFVTIVQMVVEAFAYSLYQALGIYCR